MEKQNYDEKNGLWYELHGDYYLLCLAVPPEEKRAIGVCDQQHLRYLRQHRTVHGAIDYWQAEQVSGGSERTGGGYVL